MFKIEPKEISTISGDYWWSQAESNRRPLECHSSALPTELWPLEFVTLAPRLPTGSRPPKTSVRGGAFQDQIARTEINLVAPSASLFLPDLGGINIRFSQDVIIIVITVIGQSGDGVVIVVIVDQLVDFT